MTQSSNATLGMRLLWAALIIWTCEVLLSWLQSPVNFLAVLGQILAFSIWWYINVKVAAGHAWARVMYVVCAIPAVLILVLLTALLVQVPVLSPAYGLFILAGLWLPSILQVIGLLLLFSETSSGGKIGVVFVVSVAIVAGAAALLEPRIMSALNSDPKSSFFLRSVANKARQEQRLPAMVDDDTEMFDIKARTGMLIYDYRLVKVNANEFDAREYL